MNFEFWKEGLIFIGSFSVIIGFPCIMAAILGTRLIDNIGTYPSKSTAMQIKVALQMGLVQLISFTLLAVFFHVISD